MVTVSVSETYDLSTKVNKMTLIGIHTPKKELIQKTYPGLCMNCRYFRIKSVDVTLATAQQLPLGVEQIGLDNDKIRPQDMMNPILYKATSNDSFSTLEARLHGLLWQTTASAGVGVPVPLEGNMAFAEDDNVTAIADEHDVYYSLLSNRDGWKMSPVQNGVRMKGLVPLVFEKWYTSGENDDTGNNGVTLPETAGSEGKLVARNGYLGSMRGRPHPMPKINTTFVTGVLGDGNESGSFRQNNGMGDGLPRNCQCQMPDIPPVMLGCIVLPPATATSGIIYYRMVTRAYIEFTDVRPITEITSFSQMDSVYAGLVYHSDYNEQSKMMDATTDMVDVKNAEIEKIMEGR